MAAGGRNVTLQRARIRSRLPREQCWSHFASFTYEVNVAFDRRTMTWNQATCGVPSELFDEADLPAFFGHIELAIGPRCQLSALEPSTPGLGFRVDERLSVPRQAEDRGYSGLMMRKFY